MARTHFETLRVYQHSERLADDIWRIVERWKPFPPDTVGKQIVRAADSVGANLAEGSGKGALLDQRRFVRMARGSLYETKHWLRRAYVRKLLSTDETNSLKTTLDELTRTLNGYIRSISDRADLKTTSRMLKSGGNGKFRSSRA
jgi:four helix bundle protein